MTDSTESERTTLLIAYVLHALSLVAGGLTSIIGVIINHIKVNETQSEFIRSHHRWLIRTFWFGVVWAIVCGLLSLIAVGLLGFVALAIWWIYRIVRGILSFVDKKPMPLPA
ncbi:MAG: hypothetical protein AABY95_06640 [Pseudomonadota bacterium]